MGLLEEDHAFEIADALIAASDADETEVSIACVEDRFVRFSPDGPTQASDRERYEVRVRARFRGEGGRGFREASASAGALDEDAAFGALERATVLGRVAATDGDAMPLGGPVAVPATAPSRPTQDHTIREKGAWVGAALDAAEAADLDAGGLARTGVQCRAVVNSAGRRVFGASSVASFSVDCSTRGAPAGEAPEGTARATAAAPFFDQLDVDALVADAVQAASAAAGPIDLGPGAYDVVLAPSATAALLAFVAAAGLGAREVAEGRSFLAGRAGEALFDPRITIGDDARHAAYRGIPFDGEGTPRAAVRAVDAGVAGDPVTDARWAARLGLPNTGHARPQPCAEGPHAGALVMEPGDAIESELPGVVGDGLYVRDLHYVNLVEPAGLVLTGMTRGGLFRIEGGEITRPVRDLRFTESLVGALTRVAAVGARARRSAPLMGGEVVAPALALRGFTFTSD